MRIAFVADWLVTFGGAEHVLAELLDMYPDSPVFTTVAKRNALGPLAETDIRTSRLQNLYRLIRQHQILLPLMPRAIEDIDLEGYDVIISSSHAVAKGIVPPPSALHICYCHTPMRYAWEMEEEYLHDFRIPGLLRQTVKNRLRILRRWDLTTAKRVDVFLANSSTTQERITRTYARKSLVIPPPAADRFFTQPLHPEASDHLYFLAVGRMVPYKRFDLLIELANSLRLPLKIAGRGQDEARLRRLAGPTVEFLGFVPDNDLPQLYAQAEALLFPQYEDAGIVLFEAQASGTPVIAFKAGGALDAIEEGTTGVFFEKQTPESLHAAFEHFEKIDWDRSAIREHARKFSRGAFRQSIEDVIRKSYEEFQGGRFQRI